MQQSDVPELAHTDTRPIHWLTTAAAVAAVIALSSLIHPGPATAAQPSASTPTPAVTTAPSTTGVDFPLDCGTVKTLVVKKATGDLDGDGRPETVAAVHCDAPMGTPPDALYVLTRSADSTHARVVATLIDTKERSTVTTLSVTDGAVRATLLGYSSPDVPSCCPDLKDTVKWQWKDSRFIRSTPAGAHSV